MQRRIKQMAKAGAQPIPMELNYKGKKALIRVDFNVPLDSNNQVTDDTRIRGAIPTIKHIIDQGGAAILMSHLGRPTRKLLPDGSIDKEKFTLHHIVAPLSKLLGVEVLYCDELVCEKAKKMAASHQPGQ